MGGEFAAPGAKASTFPARPVADCVSRRCAQRPPLPTVTPPAQSIVLVDDEKSYTELMSTLLEENLQRRVFGFTRPQEALSALPHLNAAVIVTDYHMPQINGFEFIRAAAPLAPQAVFVLISGHNLTALEEEMSRLERLKGMLAKPFGWRTLADEILRVWPAAADHTSPRADATSV